ncbi:type II toxin-antitoxin system Phd/YefM family antitoxin [Nocardioides limicola]|uniref:type II toxin-antitoxin system Phd/YefM family antitoxin n=1 Tax=Nocardioides limicola TaxID=2803368 RepID=UPI00193B630C|nr:type II toxin-antitoxin system Phd/YefM family antitoxin [Nocardioides sp. DJM-14]
MQITSLSDLKAHLSEFADRAEREHERYTITRNAEPLVAPIFGSRTLTVVEVGHRNSVHRAR